MKLRVDIHEPESIHEILDKCGVEYTVQHEPYGDYLYGNVVVERKTIFDFVGSLYSGRVFEQLGNIPEEHERVLMISGTMDALRSSPHIKVRNENAIIGGMASCVVRYNLRCLLWGNNDAEIVPVMVKVVQKIDEGKSGLPVANRIKHVTKSKAGDNLHNFLRIDPSSCTKIVENAKKQKKGLIRYILDAQDSELLMIDGIGPVTLKRIRELIG